MADSVLIAAYAAGDSLDAISREWRVPERTVASRLRRAGVLIRPSGRPRKATTLLLVALNEMKKETPS